MMDYQQQTEAASADDYSPADALGQQLRGEYEESARLRKPYEDEWIK